jgi:hypothetical protein
MVVSDRLIVDIYAFLDFLDKSFFGCCFALPIPIFILVSLVLD